MSTANSLRLPIKSSTLAVVIAIIFASVLAGFMFTATAGASSFNRAKIIDDSVFTDYRSMTVSQIQNFLNSKVPVCDTNGTKPSEYGGGTRAQYGTANGFPPPYICLKNYSQGGKSAARIIYDAAQEFRISPKVLIVLLQKEQGLVTDEWPAPVQYKTATGYGCPDTAACDSQYYGFTNQVRWAGRMFRAIMDASPTWYTPYVVGSNRIYYHPDLNRCGSTNVTIQNRATAALYSYTPYQPNSAALNAGYGTGNSCSSYGNRNFHLYFNDWFGPTTGSYFFRISGSSREYIAGSNNTYYYVPTPEIKSAYGWGRTTSKITTHNSNYLDGKTYAGHLKPLARFENDAVYLIDSGQKFHFTRSMLDHYGFNLGQESLLPSSLETIFRDRGAVQSIAKVNDESGTIYLVENGKKRHFVGPSAYRSGSPAYNTLSKVELSYGLLRSIPETSSIYSEGSLVRFNSNVTVYLINSASQKIVIPDRNTMDGYGFKFSNVRSVPPSRLAAYETTSAPLGSVVKDSGTYTYLITNSGKRHRIPEELYSHFGINTSLLQPLSTPLLKRFVAANDLTRVLKSPTSNDVYYISEYKKQRVASPSKLRELDFTSSDVITVSDSYLKSIPNK